jgi:hypothetical protein
MKKVVFISIILLQFFITNTYSQKEVKLSNVSVGDFSASNDSSEILNYTNFINFSYRQLNYVAGALDTLFRINAEVNVRILLNKHDHDLKYIMVPNESYAEPYLQSIKLYSMVQGKIKEKKIKKSSVLIMRNQAGYFIDFSPMMNDTIMVADIRYSYPVYSKHEMHIMIDTRKEYKNLKIDVYVPEIYKYIVSSDTSYLQIRRQDGVTGPFLGYRTMTSPYLMPKGWHDIYVRRGSLYANYTPVYCKLNLYSFDLKESHRFDRNIPMQQIINFKLFIINEIR